MDNNFNFELPVVEGAKATPRTIHVSESICLSCE